MKTTYGLIALMFGFVGSCLAQGTMNPHYDTYVAYSTDSNNNTLQTVVVEGSTSGSCQFWVICGPNGQTCQETDPACANSYHYGQINNVLGGVGGSSTGPHINPFNYMSYQTTTTLYIAPGTQVTSSWSGAAYCSAIGTLTNGGGSPPVSGYTPIQHNYPGNPLGTKCWISQFFDKVGHSGKSHHAEDVILDNGQGTGGLKPAYGAPVYAMEAGKVVKVVSNAGPASVGFPACQGQGYPGNRVNIQDTSGYTTVYYHVTPAAGITAGTQVSQGQQIGTLDNSGCQSGPHLHAARIDPSNNPVNFRIILCTNSIPTTTFADGLVDDDDTDIP